MSLTMTLNQAKLDTSIDVDFFPPLTKEQLLLDLEKSRASGYVDLDVARTELQQKYFEI